ncbi:hypothetical protein [Cellvibrio mixtus]|uniref:hypothetical protein n=1 Tax=Cellvibrio mixtus TaxID=39650 RepID=UPI000587C42E|nr:hypothetical protein [Cellvibrio mixtus]
MYLANIQELKQIFSIPEHANFIGFAVTRKNSETFLVSISKKILYSLFSTVLDDALIFNTQADATEFVNQYKQDSLVILLFDFGEYVHTFYFDEH